jgi:hypothetical protein
LRIDKVFVYFTRMKWRAGECEFFSRSHTAKQIATWDSDTHGYAQDRTVFYRPSCLIEFRLGGFLFEKEKRDAAAMVVNGAEYTPDSQQDIATRFRLRRPADRCGGKCRWPRSRGGDPVRSRAAPRPVPHSLAQTVVCADE